MKNATKSPAWEKPKDILKRHVIKRKSSKCLLYVDTSQSASSVSLAEKSNTNGGVEDSSSVMSEPLNPFKNIMNSPINKRTKCGFNSVECEEMKMINWNGENDSRQAEGTNTIDWDDTTARTSFENTSFVRKSSVVANSSFEEKFSQTINDSYPIDFSHLSSLCSSTPKALLTKEKRSSSEMPKDLRLGTKIKVISKRPFHWMTKVTTTGTHQVIIPEEDIDLAIKSSMMEETELGYLGSLQMTPLSLLHASAIYYQFPCLCSIPMFPRLETSKSDKRLFMMNNLQSLCPKFMDNILADWHQSFDHLFAMWKIKKRDFFYLCAPSFTALFIRSFKQHENCTSDDLQVVITPTSLGLRQTLRDKDIQFSLPLRSGGNFVNLTNEDCPKDFLPHPPKQGVDLDHDEWLKEIGISPKSTLKLKRSVSTIDMLKEENDEVGTASQPATRTVKHKDLERFQETKQSTILIKDAQSMENLKELLKKSKVAFTRHGPLSGLPPTLIASTPFYKSVPGDLEMTSQITKKGGELKYILELSGGPVLQNAQKKLLAFIKSLSTCPTENTLKFQVNGRACYDGINEAVDSGCFTNFTEFELDLLSGAYSW